jgi:hypothetical protein
VVINVLLNQTTTQLHLDAVAIFLLNKHHLELEFVAVRGFRSRITGVSFRLGDGYIGQAALEHRLIHIHDLAKSGMAFLHDDALRYENFISDYAATLNAGRSQT